jgi:Tfp pilus assembly protein PilN
MKRINLLPSDERVKARRERGVVYVLLGLVLLVAALGAVYVWQNNQVSTRTSDLSTVKSSINDVRGEITQLKPYKTLQDQRTAMMASATAIYNSRVTWSSILQEISLVIPDNVILTGLTANVPGSMQAGASASSSAASASDLTLTGCAPTHEDVAAFMTRLGLVPQIMNVSLVDSEQVKTTTGSPYVQYTITSNLRPFLTVPPKTTTVAGGAK